MLMLTRLTKKTGETRMESSWKISRFFCRPGDTVPRAVRTEYGTYCKLGLVSIKSGREMQALRTDTYFRTVRSLVSNESGHPASTTVTRAPAYTSTVRKYVVLRSVACAEDSSHALLPASPCVFRHSCP